MTRRYAKKLDSLSLTFLKTSWILCIHRLFAGKSLSLSLISHFSHDTSSCFVNIPTFFVFCTYAQLHNWQRQRCTNKLILPMYQVYNVCVCCRLGFFYAPLIPALATISMFVLFYLKYVSIARKETILLNNVKVFY